MEKSGHILISRLMEESVRRLCCLRLIHPLGFNSVPDRRCIPASLSAQSGKIRFCRMGVLRDRTELIIRRRKPADEEVRKCAPFRLAMETQEIMPDFVIPRNKNTACLDTDKVVLPLTVRKWRQGISLFLCWNEREKKVNDYLTDRKFLFSGKKISMWFAPADRIVWLVGERSDDRFRVTEDTKRVLIIRQLEDK